MTKMIKLECKECLVSIDIPAKDPYMGWTYGKGWTCRCLSCGGEMQEIEPALPATVCDDCGESSYVIYVIPRNHKMAYICDVCYDKERR
jgi:ribosomal protein L33